MSLKQLALPNATRHTTTPNNHTCFSLDITAYSLQSIRGTLYYSDASSYVLKDSQIGDCANVHEASTLKSIEVTLWT